MQGRVFLGLPKLFYMDYKNNFRIIKPNCGFYTDNASEQKQLGDFHLDMFEYIMATFYSNETKSIHTWIAQNKGLNVTIYDVEINDDCIKKNIILDEEEVIGQLEVPEFPIFVYKVTPNNHKILTRTTKSAINIKIDDDVGLYIVDDRIRFYNSDESRPSGIYYGTVPPKLQKDKEKNKLYIRGNKTFVVNLSIDIDSCVYCYDYYNNNIIIEDCGEKNRLIIVNQKSSKYYTYKRLIIDYPYSGLILSKRNNYDDININIMLNDKFCQIGTIFMEGLSYELDSISVVLENPDDNEDVPNLAKFLNDIIPLINFSICKLITQYCVLVISDGLDITEEFANRYKK